MEENKKSPQVAGTTSEGKQIRGITIELPTEFAEQLAKRASNFDSYLKGHASGLLSAIKKEASTYGEIKEKLMECESLIRWSNQNSHYRMVIREAKSQLEKEIYSTTPKNEREVL